MAFIERDLENKQPPKAYLMKQPKNIRTNAAVQRSSFCYNELMRLLVIYLFASRNVGGLSETISFIKGQEGNILVCAIGVITHA